MALAAYAEVDSIDGKTALAAVENAILKKTTQNHRDSLDSMESNNSFPADVLDTDKPSECSEVLVLHRMSVGMRKVDVNALKTVREVIFELKLEEACSILHSVIQEKEIATYLRGLEDVKLERLERLRDLYTVNNWDHFVVGIELLTGLKDIKHGLAFTALNRALFMGSSLHSCDSSPPMETATSQ